MENCVICYATQEQIRKRYPGEPICNHCFYHQYGCPDKPFFDVKDHGLTKRFVAIEQSADELPKVGIWCKTCHDNCAKVFHKTIWNCRPSYAIKCPHCGSEYMLYETRVHQQYTGFINGNGDFVHPDRYLTGKLQITPDVADPDPILGEIQSMMDQFLSSLSPEQRRELQERKERERREMNEPVVVYSTMEGQQQPTAMELALKKAMEARK